MQSRASRSPEAHPNAIAVQQACMGAVSSDATLKRLAGDAFRSFIRAYSTHPAALRHIFHTKRGPQLWLAVCLNSPLSTS